MDKFKLGEIIADLLSDQMNGSYYKVNVVKIDYDDSDGSVAVMINNQKMKRFLIEIKEMS